MMGDKDDFVLLLLDVQADTATTLYSALVELLSGKMAQYESSKELAPSSGMSSIMYRCHSLPHVGLPPSKVGSRV